MKVDAVALFTDFGCVDHYLGEVKAVLYGSLPTLPLYDLMTAAPRCDPRSAGYLLAALLERLPPRQLVMAVVDPGVGTDRDVLLVETDRHLLIAPDNGLLALVLKGAAIVSVHRIGWRPTWMSVSFHARDLFAPAMIRFIQRQDLALEVVPDGCWVGADWPLDWGRVIHVDHFGNLITALRASSGLDSGRPLRIAGQRIPHARTFAEVTELALFWYINSLGLVEIACNRASAAASLRVGIGAAVDWE